MTVGGWLMMGLSWVFIVSLAFYCMRRVLKLQDEQAEHLHPIYDIDTGDMEEEKEED
ncbi:MAG: hypothetical protein ACNS63_01540 [Candidatus Nitrospinota bacterium M3_3B_026]